jgi:hypothetical protein
VSGDRQPRDLSRTSNGQPSEAWLELEWILGANLATDICAWASRRDDGDVQLRVLVSTLVLTWPTHAPGGLIFLLQQTALAVLRGADPAYVAPWTVALEGA